MSLADGLTDERAFVEAAAEFARLNAERGQHERLVLRLARRLVVDATLTDEEAISAAGELALRRLLEASEVPA